MRKNGFLLLLYNSIIEFSSFDVDILKIIRFSWYSLTVFRLYNVQITVKFERKTSKHWTLHRCKRKVREKEKEKKANKWDVDKNAKIAPRTKTRHIKDKQSNTHKHGAVVVQMTIGARHRFDFICSRNRHTHTMEHKKGIARQTGTC